MVLLLLLSLLLLLLLLLLSLLAFSSPPHLLLSSVSVAAATAVMTTPPSSSSDMLLTTVACGFAWRLVSGLVLLLMLSLCWRLNWLNVMKTVELIWVMVTIVQITTMMMVNSENWCRSFHVNIIRITERCKRSGSTLIGFQQFLL